jgi:two-component system, NtrC family, response regulator PilR
LSIRQADEDSGAQPPINHYKSMAKVLLIDHEMTMLQTAAEILRSEDHDVFPFANITDALAALCSISPQLVITNFSTERARAGGLELIRKAGSLPSPAALIVITAANSTETALGAMRHGAFDYLEKPFALDELKLCARRALMHQAIVSENLLLRGQIERRYKISQIIGISPAMREVLAKIEQCVDAEFPVLIQGPAGTGKELAARTIHFQSRRRCAPFQALNCRSFADNAAKSELHGDHSEVFARAEQELSRRFHSAVGGTIFLEEIGALAGKLQNRLVEQMSEEDSLLDQTRSAGFQNVRIIAATSEPLCLKAAQGLFNEELYRRVSSNLLVLPALSERAEDIPLLIRHFLEGKLHRSTGQPLDMSREAIELCCEYSWPGHVAELENVIQRACAICAGHTIHVPDLPPAIRGLAAFSDTTLRAAASQMAQVDSGPAFHLSDGSLAAVAEGVGEAHLCEVTQPIVPLKAFLRDQELAYLQRALIHADGSKEKAAELLGVSLATIYRKLSEDIDSAAASADAAQRLRSSIGQIS